MDNFDKNTQPFTQHGDKNWVDKLQKMEANNNKIINEFLAIGEGTILDSIKAAIGTRVASRISNGEGIYKNYVAPDLLMGLGDEPPPVVVDGEFKVIGQYLSAGLVGAVSGGDIKGAATVYNLIEETFSGIYQRYRIFDTVLNAERDGFAIAAILGDYAVCVELGGDARYYAITPYNKDATLKIGSAWETDCTLDTGTDVALIDGTTEYLVIGAFPIDANSFMAISRYQTPSTRQRNLQIISFTSPTETSLSNILIDLDEFAVDSNYYFQPNGIESYAKNSDGLIAFSLKLYHGFIYYQANFAGYFDPADGVIHNTSFIANETFGGTSFISPLSAFTTRDENCFELWNNQTVGGGQGASYGYNSCNVPVGSVEKLTYTSRSFEELPNAKTVLNGASEPVTIDVNSLVNERLTDSGFTLDAGATDPFQYYGFHLKLEEI